MDRLRICYAYIEIEDINKVTPVSLRGFLGNSFVDDIEYHHHTGNSFVYRYPHIQYKKINNKILIIGINKYSYDIPIKLSRISYINTILGEKIKINCVEFKTKIIHIVQKNMKYSFQSPWIALNSNNFKQFFSHQDISKIKFLENILIGNILSMLKGLGIQIDFKLQVKIFDLQPLSIFANNNRFITFKANFDANIVIPEYAGIGKSVSKGFGTVSLLNNDR